MIHPVTALLVGKVQPAFRGAEGSAIGKLPVEGPVTVGYLGFDGDEQADPANHGGPDKAILHYPLDHYAFWREVIGDHPLLAAPGGFGENVSVLGLTDDAVCLGDRFRLGTALLEVSLGRQPCWKLGHRFGLPGLVALVVQAQKAGWYYRVIEPGVAQAGDALDLTDRPLPQWPIAKVFGALIGGQGDPAAYANLAGLDVLAVAWRTRAWRLLGK